MSNPNEQQPPRVLETAMQDGDVLLRWSWTERAVWSLNPTLVGWFAYFKHSHKYVFTKLDRWIRMPLRSMLRRRLGLRGRANGADNHRWPNKYFATHGLFSLTTAHALARQSSLR